MDKGKVEPNARNKMMPYSNLSRYSLFVVILLTKHTIGVFYAYTLISTSVHDEHILCFEIDHLSRQEVTILGCLENKDFQDP